MVTGVRRTVLRASQLTALVPGAQGLWTRWKGEGRRQKAEGANGGRGKEGIAGCCRLVATRTLSLREYMNPSAPSPILTAHHASILLTAPDP